MTTGVCSACGESEDDGKKDDIYVIDSKTDDNGNPNSPKAETVEQKVLSKQITIYPNETDDTYISTYKYSYDEKGNCIKYDIYMANGYMRYYNEYDYDDAGNVITEYIYDYDGSLTEKTNYTLNDDGEKLESITYSYNTGINYETVKNKTEYAYNTSGLLETIYVHSDTGTILERIEFTYDENNNMLEEKHYSDDILSYYFSSTYNSKNQAVLVEYTLDGVTQNKYTQEYNEAGEVEKLTIYDGNDNLQNYVIFEFDEDNSLLKETYYASDETIISYTDYTYMNIDVVK